MATHGEHPFHREERGSIRDARVTGIRESFEWKLTPYSQLPDTHHHTHPKPYSNAHPTFGTDINEDGIVDAGDLLILLEEWGRVSGVR